MSEPQVQLRAILRDVRRRWTLLVALRTAAVAAGASSAVILAGALAAWLVARDGLALLVTAPLVALIAAGVLAAALWSLRRRPTDARLARFIEERDGGLEDVLVTAVEYGSRADVAAHTRGLLEADAARRLAGANLDRIVSRRSLRTAAIASVTATFALLTGIVLFAPALSRAANVLSAYLFPARLEISVVPGTATVRAGQPLTISARIAGLDDELVPTLAIRVGESSRALRMAPASEPGTFATTIEAVTTSFVYVVAAGAARSDEYSISVVRPPKVERIDLAYEFPRRLGLAPETDEDSGDIYGPPGTTVRLTVTADKPIASASLVFDNGATLPLETSGATLTGALTIEENGSYRVALLDRDGLASPGDTEYFIRTLDDRPPEVRIMRPASDRHVTPLEEVLIEARADDDFGVRSLELVFQTPGGRERTVPIARVRGGLTATGVYTLAMENLGVQPGDFVTYYARARDVARGRRQAEARSDIFFLEVKPFEEEFVASASQAMGQGAGMRGDTGLEGLIEAQKEIIVATWKLDARARRARDAASARDAKTLATAQGELRTRVQQAPAGAARASGYVRPRRVPPGAAPGTDSLGRAADAMGRAVVELERPSTSAALPHEMEALNQLLKAAAEIRRRQVMQQAQGAAGGGTNRVGADLSSLFDRELRRRQQTNYETPNAIEERSEAGEDDLLERIRELARRQDALNRQHRDLARDREQIAEDELRRQLERLTREQNQLRQQAEQLAQRIEQQASRRSSGASPTSGQSVDGAGQQEARRMREISEDMRHAATGMRRQDSQQASASGSRASERLRDLERRVGSARPDERRRALGDLQLEARQLAESERRVANEAGRTAPGASGDDARRRLAGEQDRLAERTDRLEDQVQRLARLGAGDADERQGLADAARALEGQKLAERMKRSAEALRQPSPDGQTGAGDGRARQAARDGEAIARALDSIADRLSAAAGGADADARRLSDQLSRTRELRDKLAGLERSIEELDRESRRQDAEGQASGRAPGDRQGAESQATQRSGEAREGQNEAGSARGGSGRLQQLQREVHAGMKEAGRLAQEILRANPDLQGPAAPEDWWRSFSAPGTEAFKQDFARWQSLKKHLFVAIEDIESRASSELRARETQQRLNAGGHSAVDEAYRDLVDRYYRSLAAPRRPH